MTSNRSKNLALFPEATNTRAAVALTFLGGLGDREYDESDLPRLNGGPRPLLGEIDLERDRRGRRGGERL